MLAIYEKSNERSSIKDDESHVQEDPLIVQTNHWLMQWFLWTRFFVRNGTPNLLGMTPERRWQTVDRLQHS